ncbi:MAG: hypothetical protein AB1510_08675 [Bacillota bacterium]
MARRRLTVSKVRRELYRTARTLGDIQALGSGNPGKVGRRIGRRIAGRITGRLLGRLFR